MGHPRHQTPKRRKFAVFHQMNLRRAQVGDGLFFLLKVLLGIGGKDNQPHNHRKKHQEKGNGDISPRYYAGNPEGPNKDQRHHQQRLRKNQLAQKRAACEGFWLLSRFRKDPSGSPRSQRNQGQQPMSESKQEQIMVTAQHVKACVPHQVDHRSHGQKPQRQFLTSHLTLVHHGIRRRQRQKERQERPAQFPAVRKRRRRRPSPQEGKDHNRELEIRDSDDMGEVVELKSHPRTSPFLAFRHLRKEKDSDSAKRKGDKEGDIPSQSVQRIAYRQFQDLTDHGSTQSQKDSQSRHRPGRVLF